ncbi:DUF3231 family protein [Tuberibacillus sp. Marseille-P3662]|uniref:DUF3231 family protein n=1 Tax=Tuberibacillus sp. Marseille-P3662 TaxID=1965358 RepID=UPI000A1CF035|nr:DUF3231 family protein [Tuberibacillus sp. Marseille-P3662]
MANPIEAALKTMKTLVDNEPKQPLHVGEVYYCWFYYTTINEAEMYMKAALNTTTDDELRQVLQKSKKECQTQTKRIENFMLKEGVTLPPMPENKPDSNPKDIPLGVKLTDDEIANGISIKTAYATTLCATASTQAIRSDVSLMFMEFQAEKAVFGAEMKVFMRKRGWIKVPPHYYPPGMPNDH